MTIFLAGNASFFESLLLEWECAYICHCLRVGKKGIYSKWLEYKGNNRHTSDLHLEK